MLQRWKEAVLVSDLMWGSKLSEELRNTPRFLTTGDDVNRCTFDDESETGGFGQ